VTKPRLTLRITTDLQDRLTAAAEAAGVTPNTVAVILLSQALNLDIQETDKQQIRQPMGQATRVAPELLEGNDISDILATQDDANVSDILAALEEANAESMALNPSDLEESQA
jgi:hypothetical protein